jgi:hypothetical protein
MGFGQEKADNSADMLAKANFKGYQPPAFAQYLSHN